MSDDNEMDENDMTKQVAEEILKGVKDFKGDKQLFVEQRRVLGW